MIWIVYTLAISLGIWDGSSYSQEVEQSAFCEGYGYAAGHPDCSF